MDVSELFAQAASADEEQAHHARMTLCGQADEAVLAAGVERLRHPDPAARIAAAEVLAQLGHEAPAHVEASVDALLGALADEQDPTVVGALATALGHRRDPRAIPALLDRADHPHADVRFGVVFGLMAHETQPTLAALVTLTADADDEVRNWATFALGSQISADSPDIRAALLARLTDSHDETRGEAMVGLAERGDGSAASAIVASLSSELSSLALQAAALLGDPRFFAPLTALRAREDLTPYEETLVDEALARCDPDAEV